MMEMKSTLMKRVWTIGDGFNSIEEVEAGLIEILNLNSDAEVLAMINDTVALGGESVITFKNKALLDFIVGK